MKLWQEIQIQRLSATHVNASTKQDTIAQVNAAIVVLIVAKWDNLRAHPLAKQNNKKKTATKSKKSTKVATAQRVNNTELSNDDAENRNKELFYLCGRL